MSAADLAAYLRRIGYGGPRAPRADVLREVVRLHAGAIPFENLDPLCGKVPALDLGALQAKLVASRRGGYCYEQNVLLQHALRAMGFSARALGARVLLDKPADASPSRTHLLLLVEAEDGAFLADVGFGGHTPTGPIPFVIGQAHATPHEPYRIDATGPEYELSARIGCAWILLYRFHLIAHVASDHDVANHYVASRPASLFRRALVVARAAPGGRHLLSHDRLAFRRSDGSREERTLPGPEAVRAALAEVFRIDVPDAPAFDAALLRIASGA